MPNPKLTKSDIPRCVKLAEHGCMDKDIAAMMGVLPSTFSEWINHPRNEAQRELSEALNQARAKAKDAMLQVIMRAAIEDRTWQSAAWYLERKYPSEYARADRVSLDATHKVKADVDVSGMTDEQLRERIRELAKGV